MAVSRRFFIEMLSENKQKKPLRMEEASTIPSATIAGTKTPIDVMREWIKSAKLTTDVESVWFEEDEDYLSLTGNLQANDEERGAKKQVRRFLEHSLGNAAV